MSFSNYTEENVLDALFRTDAFVKPTELWVALLTAAPDDTSTGNFSISQGTEVSGGSYVRIQLDPADSNWTDPSGVGYTQNNAVISFPKATASWGTITHVAIVDDETTGNVIAWTALTTDKLIETNDVLEFDVNALKITLS